MGRHIRNRLTDRQVRGKLKPGVYEDGGGLRLTVDQYGNKRWSVRVTVTGNRVQRGLGSAKETSLAEARQKAEAVRQAAKAGRDLGGKRAARLGGITFRDAFGEMWAVRRRQLTSPRTIQQWHATMDRHVLPIIGDLPVDAITASDVLAVLDPIWWDTPELGRKALQRMSAVFEAAILRGHRTTASPTTGVARELGTGHRGVRHMPALPLDQIPGFVARLQVASSGNMPTTRGCLLWVILTACRSGEARGAEWSEIEEAQRLWVIPAARLKSRRTEHGPHRVPLSDRALAILGEARTWRVNDLLFPGMRGQPLSDNTLSKLMRDNRVNGTPHGFRSTFRDWAAHNEVPELVAEAALAHVVSNAVVRAYRRTDHLDERREVMQRWADTISPPRD